MGEDKGKGAKKGLLSGKLLLWVLGFRPEIFLGASAEDKMRVAEMLSTKSLAKDALRA